MSAGGDLVVRQGGELTSRSGRSVSVHRAAFGNFITNGVLCVSSCD